jgi:hypothetical protein
VGSGQQLLNEDKRQRHNEMMIRRLALSSEPWPGLRSPHITFFAAASFISIPSSSTTQVLAMCLEKGGREREVNQ